MSLANPQPTYVHSRPPIHVLERAGIWLLLIAITLLRLPFWPHARALRDGIAYSIGALITHVAHPPGSVGYCVLGGAVNRIVGNVETTFIDINLLAGLVGTYFCYALSRTIRLSTPAALLAAASYGLSVNTLAATFTIAPHLLEGVGAILTAWLGLLAIQRRQRRFAYACTLAAALIGALRPTATFFLIPLWFVSIYLSEPNFRKRWSTLLIHLAIFTVITATWSFANSLYMNRAGYGGTTYEKQVLTVAPYDYVSMSTDVKSTASRHTFHLPAAEVLAWLEPRLHVRLLPHIADWPTPSLTRAGKLFLQQAVKQATFVVVSLPAIVLVLALSLAERITRRSLLRWDAFDRSTWIVMLCWITPAALFFVFGHLGTLTYLQNYLGAICVGCAGVLCPRHSRELGETKPSDDYSESGKTKPMSWLTVWPATLCAVGGGLVFALARPLPVTGGPLNLLNVSLLQYTGFAKLTGYGASRVAASLATVATEDPTADTDYLAANSDAALIAAAYKHHFEYLKPLPNQQEKSR